MTRVLLINPPSPHRLGAPLLGQQYVAAALLAAGCEVRVMDAAARHFRHDDDWIVAEAAAWAPDLIGFTLYTPGVRDAYALAARLPRPALRVAGGPHATACPDETLRHGFDVAVIGEGEASVVRLLAVLRGEAALHDVPGIRYRDGAGQPAGALGAAPLRDLDALPFPATAQALYDPRWYSAEGGEALPGGIMTSRGCPARCTFCANYVTGRKLRLRSVANVVAELAASHRRSGSTYFQFWDDAFSADRKRTRALCEAFRRDLAFPLAWSATTRVNLVDPPLLRAMKDAGLTTLIFGVESGDDEILRAIGKGIRTEDVVRVLEWAREAGLTTVCDFMLGFPEDTPASLERTLRFMERIAPLVDSFSTLGVVIPLPGTPLYEHHHTAYGFTDWWLGETHIGYGDLPPVLNRAAFADAYCGDAALAHDFFRYSAEERDLMLACLKFKGEHNLAAMGLGTPP